MMMLMIIQCLPLSILYTKTLNKTSQSKTTVLLMLEGSLIDREYHCLAWVNSVELSGGNK
jgi:hypothetical protein